MSRKNLSEHRKRIQRRIGDAAAKGIPPSVIDEEFNKGYRLLCKEFAILRTFWTAAAVSEARFYKPPTAMIELERVDFNDNKMDFLLPDDIWKLGDDEIDLQAPTWTEDV